MAPATRRSQPSPPIRLLDAKALLKDNIITYGSFGRVAEPYIIASHTWIHGTTQNGKARAHDEKRYAANLRSPHNPVFAKVKGFCRAIKQYRPDVRWLWIDSCCMSSSHNSQENDQEVNSMFHWYRNAEVCFAYLSDASSHRDMQGSEWFKRGWTLQELAVPNTVVFFSKDWSLLGHKCPRRHPSIFHNLYRDDLNARISYVTRIPVNVLQDFNEVQKLNAAVVFSWTVDRKTKEEEDLYYSLHGIFGVSIPLHYGEGQLSAFWRLWMAIHKKANLDKPASRIKAIAEDLATLARNRQSIASYSQWSQVPVRIDWDTQSTSRPQQIIARYSDSDDDNESEEESGEDNDEDQNSDEEHIVNNLNDLSLSAADQYNAARNLYNQTQLAVQQIEDAANSSYTTRTQHPASRTSIHPRPQSMGDRSTGYPQSHAGSAGASQPRSTQSQPDYRMQAEAAVKRLVQQCYSHEEARQAVIEHWSKLQELQHSSLRPA